MRCIAVDKYIPRFKPLSARAAFLCPCQVLAHARVRRYEENTFGPQFEKQVKTKRGERPEASTLSLQARRPRRFNRLPIGRAYFGASRASKLPYQGRPRRSLTRRTCTFCETSARANSCPTTGQKKINREAEID